ncbi:MAG: hypothetical protein V9E94_19240 [Microthrixaceae bacterium]
MTRIPAFMYLTDDREKTINDIITQIEPALFQKVTGLTLDDFKQLVEARVFNDSKMNDAVWKFRTFEEPSLHYGEDDAVSHTQGGWSLVRDDRLADLVAVGARDRRSGAQRRWGDGRGHRRLRRCGRRHPLRHPRRGRPRRPPKVR